MAEARADSTPGPSTVLLADLERHLVQVKDGTQPLDGSLLSSFGQIEANHLSPSDSQKLAHLLYQLLPTLREDPTPACELLERILAPWSLATILQIEPPVDFAAGLDVRAAPYNRLTLSLLRKGVADIAAARGLATTRPEIFTALLGLWLGTGDAYAAGQAGDLLYDLLRADRELDGSGLLPSANDDDAASLSPDGPVWRRVFRDPDVYGVFYEATNLARARETGLSRVQGTLAQARLMEFVAKLAGLDWNSAVKSHIPQVEDANGVGQGNGLLYYAAVAMVDVKGDVLMHRSLITFYGSLLRSCDDGSFSSSSSPLPSPALAFLIEHRLHTRTLQLYLEPDHVSHDPIDITFLYMSAAQYVSAYATTCYWHFDTSPTKDAVIARLNHVLNIPRSRWQNSPPDPADLHVLSSVPRTSLLPAADGSSPLLCVPTKPATVNGLDVLASVLHGPIVEHTFPAREASRQDRLEAAAARRLYLAYVNYNSAMWTHVVAAADTVAMADVARSAVALVKAVATASWPASPSDGDAAANVDTDTPMTDALDHHSTDPSSAPTTGISALLTPPALTTLLPWLLRPSPHFSGVVVSGLGSAQEASAQVMMAKWGCLRAVESRLDEWIAAGGAEVEGRRGELERVRRAIAERVRKGPQGEERGVVGVGTGIATLEL